MNINTQMNTNRSWRIITIPGEKQNTKEHRILTHNENTNRSSQGITNRNEGKYFIKERKAGKQLIHKIQMKKDRHEQRHIYRTMYTLNTNKK